MLASTYKCYAVMGALDSPPATWSSRRENHKPYSSRLALRMGALKTWKVPLAVLCMVLKPRATRSKPAVHKGSVSDDAGETAASATGS